MRSAPSVSRLARHLCDSLDESEQWPTPQRANLLLPLSTDGASPPVRSSRPLGTNNRSGTGPARCIRCIGTRSAAHELAIGPRSTIVAIAMRHHEPRYVPAGVLQVARRWHELGPPPLGARDSRVVASAGAVEEAVMAIVAGFDVHRAQITFDAVDSDSGEVMRGRIDATPAAVTRWVKRFAGREIEVAVEACTGWLFVCDALAGAGAVAHLAEPVETRALRGRKRRAKTDREDARWLRELLAEGRWPEAWIPPEHVRQWRSRARLRHTLIDERTQWRERIQAALQDHGSSGAPERLRTRAGREFLDELALPGDARERIEVALAM